MDITPIYELRSRLRAATIAGTNLIQEDFRLKRALEGLAPLKAASPVFARLDALVQSLLTADEDEREGILLDALTLADALLCTQGVVEADGELAELPLQDDHEVVSDAPYSLLKTILDALTNSGGGRFTYLVETHRERPELFEDYRIKPALVRALGATYAELANQVEEWLKEAGSSVVPLLKKDFDPKGKTEMVRRVRVMEAVAGAEENEFYKKMLDEAEKDVRQALIYALRHDPSNEELLLTLVKTEKGNAKKKAYCALACQEGSGARESIEALLLKKPEDALMALGASDTDWASRLVQGEIFRLLAILEQKAASGERFLEHDQECLGALKSVNEYLSALQGKNARVIGECVKRAAELASAPALKKIHIPFSQLKEPIGRKAKDYSLPVLLGRRLQEYVMVRPDEEVLDLATGLYADASSPENAQEYFAAALLAHVIRDEDCSAWLKGELVRDRQKLLKDQLPSILSELSYNEKYKSWSIKKYIYSNTLDQNILHERLLRQQVRGEFLQLLMDTRQMMATLSKCIPAGEKDYEQTVMDYLYREALACNNEHFCASQLRAHNYPKCEGMAVQFFKRRDRLSMWELRQYLGYLPGDSEARQKEGRELIKAIRRGLFSKNKISNLNMEELERIVESL